MNIYISHSTRFDFKNDLYAVLQNSVVLKNHHLILPHIANDLPYNTKELFEKKQCDVVLAEVSYPSTGQGIELGWANLLKIRIVCFFKIGVSFSSSLKVVSQEFIAYENSSDMIEKIDSLLF